jgi:hypothetical protein
MVQYSVAWRITVKCITAEYSKVEYIVQARVLLSKEVSLSQ